MIGFLVLANLRIVAMVVLYIYPFNNMHSTNNDIQYSCRTILHNTCFKLWAEGSHCPTQWRWHHRWGCILKNPLERCLLRKHHSVNVTLQFICTRTVYRMDFYHLVFKIKPMMSFLFQFFLPGNLSSTTIPWPGHWIPPYMNIGVQAFVCQFCK